MASVSDLAASVTNWTEPGVKARPKCPRGTDGRTVIRRSEGKYPPPQPLGRLSPSSSTSTGCFFENLQWRPVQSGEHSVCSARSQAASTVARMDALGQPDRISHSSWYRSSLPLPRTLAPPVAQSVHGFASRRCTQDIPRSRARGLTQWARLLGHSPLRIRSQLTWSDLSGCIR